MARARTKALWWVTGQVLTFPEPARCPPAARVEGTDTHTRAEAQRELRGGAGWHHCLLPQSRLCSVLSQAVTKRLLAPRVELFLPMKTSRTLCNLEV